MWCFRHNNNRRTCRVECNETVTCSLTAHHNHIDSRKSRVTKPRTITANDYAVNKHGLHVDILISYLVLIKLGKKFLFLK